MKISMSWLFDHIQYKNWHELNIENLIEKIRLTTADFESFHKLNLDLNNFTLAKILDINQNSIKLSSKEFNKKFTIEVDEKDISHFQIGSFYLIKKESKNFKFATYQDIGSDLQTFLPKFYADQEIEMGSWKNQVENIDYIIDIDNKAITNRPDLWGHRGFAREIAAILDLQISQEDEIIYPKTVKNYDNKSPITSGNPFTISIENTNACKRLACLHVSKIENRASDLKLTFRLAKVDVKSINSIVDITNYVMYDIGQPMHAFDAQKIQNKKIIAKLAQAGEKLKLIGDTEIELNSNDCVIYDGQTPISLAGIKGGQDSSISNESQEIILESGNFDATTIRKSSAFHKIRTDSSSRFEKSLDPNQNTNAILRFLKICKELDIKFESSDSIASLGYINQENIIQISHNFIEDKIGTTIQKTFVEKTLSKLGFGVSNTNNIYDITVPTFRAQKDITIKEDIVEEIARFFGYQNIPQILPTKVTTAFENESFLLINKIKEYIAFGLKMHEIQSYCFYDEEFLRKYEINVESEIFVESPVSLNWKRLISSHIPNLLKAVELNSVHNLEFGMFEINPVWQMVYQTTQERRYLSGMFFEKKTNNDFYIFKDKLQSLFDILRIKIDWHKYRPENKISYFDKNQSASIIFQDKKIGSFGKINQDLSSRIFSHIQDMQLFAFEIDIEYLITNDYLNFKTIDISKFPSSDVDISFLVKKEFTVAEISHIIKNVSNNIKNLDLIDFFEKPEWPTERSLTFRLKIHDDLKTLTKDEINLICNNVIAQLQKQFFIALR